MPASPAEPSSAADVSRWTPAIERRAVHLYLTEGFSAADVAAVLGSDFSASAVIGKLRRMGIAKGRGAHGCGVIRQRVEAKIKRPPTDVPLPPLREVGPTGVPRPLSCLPARACRWPIDDPGPGRMHLALFCGGHVAGPGVYCTAHLALSLEDAA